MPERRRELALALSNDELVNKIDGLIVLSHKVTENRANPINLTAEGYDELTETLESIDAELQDLFDVADQRGLLTQ